MTDTVFNATIVDLLRFALLSAGITYLLTQSRIFALWRRLIVRNLPTIFTYFVYCPACTGAWVGAALASFGFWPIDFGFAAMLEATIASLVINRVMPVDDIYTIELGGNHHVETETSENGDA